MEITKQQHRLAGDKGGTDCGETIGFAYNVNIKIYGYSQAHLLQGNLNAFTRIYIVYLLINTLFVVYEMLNVIFCAYC